MILNFFKKESYVSRSYLKNLKKLLGFNPRNINFYILAFTHKSADSIDFKDYYDNNERLEYLGDSILDAAISDLLYKRFPSADEGFLTKMRTRIVNGKKLTELGQKLQIGKLLFVKSPKNITERVYEDAFEALIGAIYLDRGFKYVCRFVSQKIMVEHIDLNKLKFEDTNYKSKIIEWSQKHKISIEFSTEEESEDSKNFISYLKINDQIVGKGYGFTKKTAEQGASQLALEKIKTGDFYPEI